VWDPELDPTPQRALVDQEADAERQLRMKIRLDEIKQRFSWDTSRAWTYLRDVVKDPLFQVEEQQSEPAPAGMSPRELDQTPNRALEDQKLGLAKRMIRDSVTAQLAELDAQIHDEYPQMEASGRQALSEERDPELHRYARAVESGEAWQSRKEPVYRYLGEVKTPAKSLRQAELVKAKNPPADDREVMLVMAEDGTVVDLELR
jgi:hypothetical protein